MVSSIFLIFHWHTGSQHFLWLVLGKLLQGYECFEAMHSRHRSYRLLPVSTSFFYLLYPTFTKTAKYYFIVPLRERFGNLYIKSYLYLVANLLPVFICIHHVIIQERVFINKHFRLNCNKPIKRSFSCFSTSILVNIGE